jgi:hypothetical protein
MTEPRRMWQPGDLYETCPICEGSGRADPEWSRSLARTLEIDGRITCPACDGYRVIPTGMTLERTQLFALRIKSLTERAEQAEAELARLRQIEENPPPCPGH